MNELMKKLATGTWRVKPLMSFATGTTKHNGRVTPPPLQTGADCLAVLAIPDLPGCRVIPA